MGDAGTGMGGVGVDPAADLRDRLCVAVLQRLKAVSVAPIDRAVFADAKADWSDVEAFLTDRITFRLIVAFVGRTVEEHTDDVEEVPADWWQAVRERWAPRWWLERHPVVKREIVTHITRHANNCPHYTRGEIQVHVDHLLQGRPS